MLSVLGIKRDKQSVVCKAQVWQNICNVGRLAHLIDPLNVLCPEARPYNASFDDWMEISYSRI